MPVGDSTADAGASPDPRSPGHEGPQRRIVFVTQVVDADDPALGFVANWMRALQAQFDDVVVIANEVRGTFPGVAVFSLGKERGAGRISRAFRYLALLIRLVDRTTPVLAHMCPIYANLGAPIVRQRGAPLILWYAHPSRTPALRIAERLVSSIVTSLPGSYPGRPPHLHRIGQGTDVDRLPLQPPPVDSAPFRLVAIGRTSPSKGFATIVCAVGRLRGKGLDVRLRLVGPSLTQEERRHRAELGALVSSMDLTEAVRVEPGVAHSEVPRIIGGAHALVNAMVAGSGDKVVFEAMAMGRPVLVSNPSFKDLLSDIRPPLMFVDGDIDGLADAIEGIMTMEPSEMEQLGGELRRRVEVGHSLESWGRGLLEVVDAHPEP